jgi:Ras-related protein Rab-33B
MVTKAGFPTLPPTGLSTRIEMIDPPQTSTINNQANLNASFSPQTSVPKPRAQFTSKRVFKVIIIGDAGVGKTCLSFRFCNNRFPAQTEATIGVDFREKTLTLENELIRTQLWDTAGQERYRQSITGLESNH